MKLHEFLKQFEGLDPELEVFQQHWSDKIAVIPTAPKVKTSYIHSKYIDIGFQSDKQTKFHDKKAIVLY